MEKTLRSLLHESTADSFLSSATKLPFRTSKSLLKSLIHSQSQFPSSLPHSLHSSISHLISSLQHQPHSPLSPPTKRVRRSGRLSESNASDIKLSDNAQRELHRRNKVVEELQILSHIVLLCVTHPESTVFDYDELYDVVKLLHDNLMLFECDVVLLGEISMLCEEWWRRDLKDKETVISLFLPVLLSKSLTEGKKVDVHRVYALREAFELFDFEDESIEDLKMLLMRTVITPVYWKSEEGRKFIAFMFGLNVQLMKDAFAMMKAQIPFGKKSMLDACGEILFRAWKVAKNDKLDETENGFVQSLIESAILASSSSLSASIRRILGGFINQRTSEGVEKLLYRLAEPIIFRSLQAANSNVRLNALHLFLDLFPMEDPDSTKDIKDMLLNKQFFLVEKLLRDDCPDIRVIAVEGSCRILHLFWEIIPSSTIAKLIILILDDMSHDVSKEVRLSSLNGLIFLLGNPQTHELLKVLLPRIGHLLFDPVLSVRAAFADLLLSRDIHSFQFNKVVDFDKLLSALETDHPSVAQKVTRLLMPSYFPSKVTVDEACTRCVTLMKRAPEAGARFCEYVILEGASRRALSGLVSAFINVVLSPKQPDTVQAECLIVGAAYLCNYLISDASYKASLKAFFSDDKLKQLVAVLSTGRAKAALFNIISAISVDAPAEIVRESIRSITNCHGLTEDMGRHAEARSIHKFLLQCGHFEELLDVVASILNKTASCFDLPKRNIHNGKGKKSKSSGKVSANDLNDENKFSVAAGLACQIREMLVAEDIRKRVLESSRINIIFSALKDISEASIMCCARCGFVESSPFQAYTTLAIHLTLQNDSQTLLDETVDHVICVTEKLLKVLKIGNFDNLPTTNLDNTSKMHFCGKQRMEDTSCSPNKHGQNPTDEVKHVNIMCIFSAVLKFLADVLSLQLYSSNPIRCLNIALAYTQYMTMLMNKNIEDQLQLKDDNTNVLYLKSSSTYIVKILSQVLIGIAEGVPPPAAASHLVNKFLDLIVSVELNLGSSYASQLVSAVKPWVPDIVVTLAYSCIADAELGKASIDSDQRLVRWHSSVAEIELSEIDENSAEAQTTEISKTCKFSGFKKLIALLLESVHGSVNMLDAFGVNILSSVLAAIEKRDFRIAFGILHFVCAKLTSQSESIWGELNLMLPSMISIYTRINKEIQELEIDGDERQQLQLANALIKPVWIYHTYEMERGHDKSQMPMEE